MLSPIRAFSTTTQKERWPWRSPSSESVVACFGGLGLADPERQSTLSPCDPPFSWFPLLFLLSVSAPPPQKEETEEEEVNKRELKSSIQAAKVLWMPSRCT